MAYLRDSGSLATWYQAIILARSWFSVVERAFKFGMQCLNNGVPQIKNIVQKVFVVPTLQCTQNYVLSKLLIR